MIDLAGIAAIVFAVAALVTSVGATIVAVRKLGSIEEKVKDVNSEVSTIHLQMNSRFDEFIALTRAESGAAGEKRGREAEQSDALARNLAETAKGE